MIYQHVSKLQLETVEALHPANTECPQCKGTVRVPTHHGLREPAVRRSWLGQGDARPVVARKAVDPPVVLA